MLERQQFAAKSIEGLISLPASGDRGVHAVSASTAPIRRQIPNCELSICGRVNLFQRKKTPCQSRGLSAHLLSNFVHPDSRAVHVWARKVKENLNLNRISQCSDLSLSVLTMLPSNSRCRAS